MRTRGCLLRLTSSNSPYELLLKSIISVSHSVGIQMYVRGMDYLLGSTYAIRVAGDRPRVSGYVPHIPRRLRTAPGKLRWYEKRQQGGSGPSRCTGAPKERLYSITTDLPHRLSPTTCTGGYVVCHNVRLRNRYGIIRPGQLSYVPPFARLHGERRDLL